MAETLEALRFKADLPARLGDSVGNAALIFTEHVFDRVTSAQDDEATEQHPAPIPASNESAIPRETGQPSGPQEDARGASDPRSSEDGLHTLDERGQEIAGRSTEASSIPSRGTRAAPAPTFDFAPLSRTRCGRPN